jgi:hypothetical protein
MGDMSKAGSEKSRLEERQRSEKRHREEKQVEFKPRWFDLTEEVTSTPWGDLEVYKYNGKYTEHRKLLDNSDTDKTNIEQLKSIMFNPWQFDSPADHVPHGNQVLAVNSKSTSL